MDNLKANRSNRELGSIFPINQIFWSILWVFTKFLGITFIFYQHPVKVLCRKEISSKRKWNIHSIIHIDAIVHLVVCCLLLHFHAISPAKEKLKQKLRKVNKMHTFWGKSNIQYILQSDRLWIGVTLIRIHVVRNPIQIHCRILISIILRF